MKIVFNQDALYRAYKKRLKSMPFDKNTYDEQIQSVNSAVDVFILHKQLFNNTLYRLIK